MNTQPHTRPVLFVTMFLAFLTVTSLACSSFGLHVTAPVVEVTLTQEEFNQPNEHGPLNAEFHLDGPCRDLLDEVTNVELHDGFIRFIGIKHLGDNSVIDGSMDVLLTAKNDALLTEIIAVDILGFDLTHPCIAEFNKEAEKEFQDMLRDSHGEMLFKEVKVEEGVLKMKIQVNVDL